MKELLSILFLVSASHLFAQDPGFSDKLWVDGKVLNKDSTAYSGFMMDYWPSTGKVKRSAKAEQGLLTGNCKEFYENGQLRYIKQFRQGKLVGMITEYFRNGELKMQAEIGRQSRMGGNDVNNLLYAYYDGKGAYINKVKGKARIVFMTADKLSNFYNDQLPLHWQDGYRVFDGSNVDYGIFIEDSRDLISPEHSNHVPLPTRQVEKVGE